MDQKIRNDNGDSKAAFYDKRRVWLGFVCELSTVSDRAFRAGYWLAMKMNGQDQCCWYTQRQICKSLGMSDDTLARAIAELEKAGLMIVVRTHRKPNVYYIRLPFEFG